MSLDFNLSGDTYDIAELPLNFDWVPIRDTEYNGSAYAELKDTFVFDLTSVDNDFIDISRMQLRGSLKIITATLTGGAFNPEVNFADRAKMEDIQVNGSPMRAFVRSTLRIDSFLEVINEPNEVYNYHVLSENAPKYVEKFRDLTGIPLPSDVGARELKTLVHQASTASGYLRADQRDDALVDNRKYQYIDVNFVIPLCDLHKSLRLLQASRGLPVQLELQTQKDPTRVYIGKDDGTDYPIVTNYAFTKLELWVPRMRMPEINEAKLERTIATANTALKAYAFSQHLMSPLIQSNAYTYSIPPQKNRVVKAIVYFTDEMPATARAKSNRDKEMRKHSTGNLTHLVLRQNNNEVKNLAYHFTTPGDSYRIFNDFLESNGDNIANPHAESPLSYTTWSAEQKYFVFDCNIRDNDKLNNLSIRCEFDTAPNANMHVILVTENELRLSSGEDSRLLCENTSGQTLKYM